MTEQTSGARLREKLSRALTLFASVTLFVIMWLVVIDVVSRDAFNYSIVGLFEVIEILMGILVFAGVPIVTANQGHIAVNLLDSFIGPKLRLFQKVAVNLLCTAVLVLFAWRLWDVAGKLAGYNDVTLFLKIPLAPVGYFMAIMTMISVPIQIALTFLPDRDRSDASAENI
jgi:TRAP-type transport system small permease protein